MKPSIAGPRRRGAFRLALLSTVLLTGLLGGCAGPAVQPWERGTLARSEMSFNGNQLDSKFAEHIYSSKEAAAGGAGVGGGGCGCN
ncbi:DUF4266 domain-containing protein [Duganella sp. BuS-21]|uniref:DUF4266 domain-containing protein n=1 Tax=Duganella sp. BuS-21 TaxID=2943848 RepID=UPI0035A5AD37